MHESRKCYGALVELTVCVDDIWQIAVGLYILLTFASTATAIYSVSQKNIPDIFSCNSRKYCRIFIMFGTHDTEKVSNQ